MEFLRFLETMRTPLGDTIFSWITRLGEDVVGILFVVIVFWCIDKTRGYILMTSFACSGIVVQGCKVIFKVPRPWVLDENFHPVASAMKKATGYSFPSGHTQMATSLFGTAAFLVKKKWKMVSLMLLCIAIGFSRMYLGVHTPKDVIASFVISLSIALIIIKVFRNDKKHKVMWLYLSLAAISFLVAVSITFFYYKGMIEYKYAADCLKMTGGGIGYGLGCYLEQRYIQFSTKTSYVWQQILKVFIGLAGLLILKEGLKVVLGASLLVQGVRYFILILWVLVIWPCFFKLFSKENVVEKNQMC